ncbi:spermine synthase [Mesonia sp. MT50]|uniref:Spermine synthase n=1 Tax=Mesonia profundi TaxID=3070998 RepID=A0ABU0ZXN9_9FLAO|nr:methyltransferase domain-containing protein [Mesonia profundi]MDQ7916235.1 spermine synthase [Mesonia profundi]
MKNNLNPLSMLNKKIKSDYSGMLEITWLNGRKILNTQQANYSYGALHEILKIGLEKTYPNRAGKVLVLGLGGGSILELLRKNFSFTGSITAVEIDAKIIEIAKDEFKIQQYEPLQVVCQDATDFVQTDTHFYETLIVDLFIGTQIPTLFLEIDFWQHVENLLQPHAVIIFNAGIKNAHQAAIDILIEKIAPLISFEKLEAVNGVNTLLLGKKIVEKKKPR